jgi:hypothetical protein
MTGKQITTTKIAYISKNAPPPFLAAPTGNPTKLPIPTAEPAAASTKPSFEPNCSREPAMRLPFSYYFSQMLTVVNIKVLR